MEEDDSLSGKSKLEERSTFEVRSHPQTVSLDVGKEEKGGSEVEIGSKTGPINDRNFQRRYSRIGRF